MAAKALQEAVNDLAPQVEIRHIDVLEFFPNWVKTFFLRVYLKSLVIAPRIYAVAYTWGNKESAGFFKAFLDVFLAGKLKRIIKEFSPDCILCTHAAPMGAVCRLKRREELRVPVYGVVTDFVVHRLWMHTEAQGFFLAHDSLRKALISAGVFPERLLAYGIPLRKMFTVKNIAGAKKYGCSGTVKKGLVFLICGGGTGLLPMEQILAQLNQMEVPFTAYFVTGKNQAVYDRLQKKAGQSKHEIRVFHFVEDMAALMEAADLVISKAGGLTSAEALAKQKPLVIYQPLPGQEAANAAFLTAQNAAKTVHCAQDLVAFLNRLSLEPELLQSMQRQAAALAKPKAAQEIAEFILRKL